MLTNRLLHGICWHYVLASLNDEDEFDFYYHIESGRIEGINGGHPLLDETACRNRKFAYFTRCITSSVSFLQQCYASIASLLVTTDPACVVVQVSDWVYRNHLQTFMKNGVSVVITPEYAPLSENHPYASLTGSADNSSWDRFYSFTKFEAARFTEFEKVFSFDPDVLFMRNASQVETLQEDFGASRSTKGKDPEVYINNGVMLLKPSLRMYSELLIMWRRGDYELYFSNDENSDQDVFTELCWVRGRCGSTLDLDACIYNHGTWLPIPLKRSCDTDKVIARHNFAKAREELLTKNLAESFEFGASRRSIVFNSRSTCFASLAKDEHGVPYTFSRCCNAIYLNGLPMFPEGGDPECWDHTYTYENCCMPWVSKADDLQRDLLRVGDTWYGLSSIPDHPSTDTVAQQCIDDYMRQEHTFISFSSHPNLSYDWRHMEMPLVVWLQSYKCNGMGRFVLFEIDWYSYLPRYAEHLHGASFLGMVQRLGRLQVRHSRRQRVASVKKNANRSHREHRAVSTSLSACVPIGCCANLENLHGLRVVLWRFVVRYILRAEDYESVLEVPEEEEFKYLLYKDVGGITDEWTPCKRNVQRSLAALQVQKR